MENTLIKDAVRWPNPELVIRVKLKKAAMFDNKHLLPWYQNWINEVHNRRVVTTSPGFSKWFKRKINRNNGKGYPKNGLL